jgi:uncharacterized membrane protein YcaP (DUF421 family)
MDSSLWNDLFVTGIPLLEKVLRTVLVYVAIAVLLRLVGKRNLAQLNTFDLVVVLLLSNVVQNAVIGPDNSLVGGLIGAAVLLGINAGVVRLAARSETLSRWIDGTPTVIVRDGEYDEATMRRMALRPQDVAEALLKQGARVSEVREAELDPNGAITFDYKDGAQPATRADIDRLMARIDALAARG